MQDSKTYATTPCTYCDLSQRHQSDSTVDLDWADHISGFQYMYEQSKMVSNDQELIQSDPTNNFLIALNVSLIQHCYIDLA